MNQQFDPKYHGPEWQKQLEELFKNFGGPGKFVGPLIAIIVVWGAFSTYYQVDPDEEAVVIRLGRYSETTKPGPHFKMPFGIDRITKIKTTKIHQAEFGFRTESSYSEGRTQYSKGNYQKESLMLTGDLNIADVEWVVQYKKVDPYKYLFKASNPIQNIRDVSESIMRRVVGDQLVNEVLTTGRAGIASEVKILMQDILNKYDIGVEIVAVKLQDVNPPETVKASFNEVNEAKQEQEKLVNQAEEKYNQVIPEARGKADEKISRAEGYALAVVNRAIGDAKKFSAVLTEYKRAPSITRKRMYLETMESIFKNFEDVTIIDSKVKGILPVFKGMESKI